MRLFAGVLGNKRVCESTFHLTLHGFVMPLTRGKQFGFALGVLALLAFVLVDSPLQHHPQFGAQPARAAGVAALMAIWWLTDALPIGVTASMPLVLFPLFQVFGAGFTRNLFETISSYFDPYNFLFAGGMCIAAAMQQCHLHRRVALNIMNAIGTAPARLLLGVLAATAFISMWISNTATATMMMPIGLAMILQLEAQLDGRRLQYYGCALMLAIAYASNLGGLGTKIGTAPNAQFAGFMHGLGIEISFLQFLLVGLPFVLMFLPITWYMLWRIGRRDHLPKQFGATVIADELRKLGPIKNSERAVFAVFLLTAAMWIFGKLLTELVQAQFPAVKITSAHIEGGIAMLAAVVLLLLRVEKRQTLEWRSLRFVSWESLLLLGGGFAMAAGIQKSGLSEIMGMQLAGVRDMSPFLQVVLTSVSTVSLSAVATNTATIAVMLNVLKDAVAPEMLTTVLFTATIAASCDFALPAGTPPNAIVFGSGYITIPRMAKTGVVLDLAAALVSAVWCWMIVRLVL